jgi:hypothetical protein
MSEYENPMYPEEFYDDHLYPPHTITVYRCFKSQCEAFTKLRSKEERDCFLQKAQDIAVRKYEEKYTTLSDLCMEGDKQVPAFPDEIGVEMLIDQSLREAYEEYKERT